MLLLRTAVLVLACLVSVSVTQVLDQDATYSIKRSVSDVAASRVVNMMDDSIQKMIIGKDTIEKFVQSIKLVESQGCKHDLNITLWALLDRVPWAVAMYDSSVKATAGIESGSVYQFGNFDECVNSNEIMVITDDDNQRRHPHVFPKYCLADVTLDEFSVRKIASRKYQPANKTIVHWGVCIPQSCSTDDIQIFMTGVLDRETYVSDSNCYRKDEFQLTTGMIIYCTFILCFILIVVFFTCYDVYLLTRRSICKLPAEGCFEMIVKAFSIIENSKKLVQRGKDQMGLEAINGIKALSMTSIICGHALLFIIGGPVENSDFLAEDIKRIQNGFLLNSTLFVDTFLLLSGFLFCRILLKELENREGKINPLILYVCRYIRLTPAYLAVIFFYITWLPHIGSGPIWKARMLVEQERCQSSWWLNILYVNNYFGTDKLCMFQSWYLSVDTQLFILAPCIIYLLWKNRQLGVHVLSLCVIVTAIFPFAITYIKDWDPTLLVFADEISDISTNKYFIETYIKTHMRATAYVFGLLTGFILHFILEKKITIPRTAVVSLWIVSSIVGVLSMFSITFFFVGPFSSLESALYAGLHRVGWSFFTGWLIIGVLTDNARFLKSILSAGVFIPFSRLTYCAYLSNGLVELYKLGTTRSPVHMSHIGLLGEVTSHNLLTFLVAIVLCLLFESPIHGFEKIFLRRNLQRRHANQDKNERTPSTSDDTA